MNAERDVRTWIGLRTSELKEQVMLCYEVNGERCDTDGVCRHKAACDAMWLVIRDSANSERRQDEREGQETSGR